MNYSKETASGTDDLLTEGYRLVLLSFLEVTNT